MTVENKTTATPSPEPTSAPAPEGTPAPTAAPQASPEPTAAPEGTPAPTAAPEPEKKPYDKKDDEKKADDKKDDKAGPPKAPEKYELKAAEGGAVAPEVQTKFETLARELDLSQDQAQKLFDLSPDINKMFTNELIKTAEATTKAWADQTRNDKEIGGGGNKAALDANLALAAKAREAFASPDLLKLLDTFDPKNNPNGTGLGNHPEVVRLFTRLGKAISEDNKLVPADRASEQAQDAATRLYGNTTPKKT